MAALKPGTTAPAINLPMLDGRTFSLADALAPGPVALAFFRVSCPVCQYAFPYFERMASILKNKGLTFVGISQDNTHDTQGFVERFGISFRIALDDTKRYPVSNAYGLTNVPTLIVVDENGVISHSIVSWSREDMEGLYAEFRDSQNADIKLFPAGENVAEFKAG